MNHIFVLLCFKIRFFLSLLAIICFLYYSLNQGTNFIVIRVRKLKNTQNAKKKRINYFGLSDVNALILFEESLANLNPG